MAIAKLTHMSDEEFRWLVGHTGRITQPAFEVLSPLSVGDWI